MVLEKVVYFQLEQVNHVKHFPLPLFAGSIYHIHWIEVTQHLFLHISNTLDRSARLSEPINTAPVLIGWFHTILYRSTDLGATISQANVRKLLSSRFVNGRDDATTFRDQQLFCVSYSALLRLFGQVTPITKWSSASVAETTTTFFSCVKNGIDCRRGPRSGTCRYHTVLCTKKIEITVHYLRTLYSRLVGDLLQQLAVQ